MVSNPVLLINKIFLIFLKSINIENIPHRYERLYGKEKQQFRVQPARQ